MALALKASTSVPVAANAIGTTLTGMINAVSGSATAFYNHHVTKKSDDYFIVTIVWV